MLKIYLTNLGKYNEGELVGEWVELPATDEELEKVKERIGINKFYEEWFITENGYDLEDALEVLDDVIYYSNCEDMEDVAYKYVEETGLLNNVPQEIARYFDYAAFGRDIETEGNFIFTDDGNCIQVL